MFGYCLGNSCGVILCLCTNGTRHISNGDISNFGKLIADYGCLSSSIKGTGHLVCQGAPRAAAP